jgi:hypothetical protein
MISYNYTYLYFEKELFLPLTLLLDVREMKQPAVCSSHLGSFFDPSWELTVAKPLAAIGELLVR